MEMFVCCFLGGFIFGILATAVFIGRDKPLGALPDFPEVVSKAPQMPLDDNEIYMREYHGKKK